MFIHCICDRLFARSRQIYFWKWSFVSVLFKEELWGLWTMWWPRVRPRYFTIMEAIDDVTSWEFHAHRSKASYLVDNGNNRRIVLYLKWSVDFNQYELSVYLNDIYIYIHQRSINWPIIWSCWMKWRLMKVPEGGIHLSTFMALISRAHGLTVKQRKSFTMHFVVVFSWRQFFLFMM